MNVRNNSEKTVVLFDVDGVIGNFVKLFINCANEALSLNVDPDTFVSDQWEISDCLGLTPDEKSKVDELLFQPGRGLSVEVFSEAQETIQKIAEFADVCFVTAQVRDCQTWTYDRAQWLIKHFGELGENVIFTHHKQYVYGDFFIDDKPENIDIWLKHWPDKMAILWQQSYNKDSGSLYKLSNWNDLYELISFANTLKQSNGDFNLALKKYEELNNE